MRKNFLALIFSALMLTASIRLAPGQPAPQDPAPREKVPVMDGGAGPCSLELTVNDTNAKPVYAVIVKVHISYGFAGIRRLDLEAGTNSEGRVKFAGLPARVHRPPLEFHAAKDNLQGMATYDPSGECAASRTVILAKPNADSSH